MRRRCVGDQLLVFFIEMDERERGERSEVEWGKRERKRG
jgi:hypothetical protein